MLRPSKPQPILNCNICRTPIKVTGQPMCCPTCGMRYWPHERSQIE